MKFSDRDLRKPKGALALERPTTSFSHGFIHKTAFNLSTPIARIHSLTHIPVKT